MKQINQKLFHDGDSEMITINANINCEFATVPSGTQAQQHAAGNVFEAFKNWRNRAKSHDRLVELDSRIIEDLGLNRVAL